jgi:TonB-linked SusC/RagA family outer membrane protein
MRRFLSLFTMLMLCGVLAFAQSRVVTGKVTDENGNPVSFASVKVKGTNTGAIADANGAYSLKVNPNTILVITGASFKDTEVPVGTQNVLNTVMEKAGTDIKEVVVTSAFGTKRTARSTASNTQNVSGDQLNTIRQTNVNNALAGKVAGIQVRSQSAAKLGVETVVRLRGENGIGIGGGALYVVDGTLMPSSQDINPDDIEDVTVLQGPAAAALFGPDAANGAIVITSKKGKKAQRGIGLEINTGIQFDKIYILPDFQNSYGGGTNANFSVYNYKAGDPEGWKALDGKFYPDYTEDVSWGPRLQGQEYIPWYAWYSGSEYAFKTAKWLPQPNNVRDYFNTGVTKLNNVNFSKAGEGFNIRASYTNLDQKGLIPTSYLKKNTLNLVSNFDLGSRFSLSANINYINQVSNAENDDAYANQTSGNFNQWFHRNLDMNIMRELKDLRGPNGEIATWNHNNPEAYSTADNGALFYKAFYWHGNYAWQETNTVLNKRNRLFGDVGLTYKVNNDLKVKLTYRRQQLVTNIDERQYNALDLSAGTNSGFNNFEPALNGRARTFGGYRVTQFQDNRQNIEFLATYNKKIKSFQLGIIAGADVFKRERTQLQSRTDGGLVVPDQFILTNSRNAAITTQRIDNNSRRSLFGNASIGFRNFLFVDGTFRRDYLSTEADPFYIDSRSVGLAFVFSDLIKKAVPFISYGKIRASTGKIINALNAYQNNQVYAIGINQFNGNFVMGEPNALVDPLVRGNVNDEKEAGIELRFLKNRIGITATYWDRTNKDFPLDAAVSPYTGYTTVTTNAGEVKKTGIDLQLFLNPLKMKNFDWTLNATWGKLLKNDVISINSKLGINTQRQQLSGNGNIDMVAAVGQRWGQLRGVGILRNAAGVPILTADGLYTPVNNVDFGSSLPDYTGGVQSAMTVFKNFVININVDYSVGGKYFSLSDFYGNATGNFKNSAGLNDKGVPVREAVSNGGGIHSVGVDATGKVIDVYVEPRYWFEKNGLLGSNIAETSIRDLTFVKLRELSIGYKLPVERLGIGKFLTSAVFSVVSRNPWLIYVKQKGFDPSELTNASGENGQLPGTRSLGVNLKLGF